MGGRLTMIRVVVVEDEALVKKGLILTTDWEKFDCEVVGEASNGIGGLEKIAKLKPDIVLTDVRMPGLDGIGLIKRAKENGLDPVFIIISGYSEFENARQALKLGVCDFLVKPIDDEDLNYALENACNAVRDKQRINKIQNKMEDITESRIMLFKEYLLDEKNDDYAARAVKYIKLNYYKDITVKNVADSLYISESYLSRLFKSKVGQTFGDYLTYYRIKKACEFLSRQDNKIYEVANLIGYKDQHYFSVIFKKLVGVTPREFRERLE